VVIPADAIHSLSSIVYKKGSLTIGDNSKLETIGIGHYGALRHVLICKNLSYPLISVKYLTNELKCLVFHSENRAFIINNFSSKENEQDHFKVVASATIDENDNLYHIDDMEKFKILSNFPPIVESDDDDDSSDSHHEAHVNYTAQEIKNEPYTAQEIKNGSARTFLKSSRQFLTLLQWLHVRLGHCNEQLLKHIVKEM
jgi:hypothetical protein